LASQKFEPVTVCDRFREARSEEVSFTCWLLALNRTVKRNSLDSMFQFAVEEAEIFETPNWRLKFTHGGRRYVPYVFTEQASFTCWFARAQLIKVLQCPRHRDRVFDLSRSQVMELDTLADDVGQSLFESEWSILERRYTIGKHLLQSCSAMANATKYEVVDAQKLEGDIPPIDLASGDHCMRKLHHVIVDSDCYVTTGCVAMREVPVFVGQYGAKTVLLEIIEYANSNEHNSVCLIL
jgi:hypothetical protein